MTSSRNGFSLLELLVVIAIIAIMAAAGAMALGGSGGKSLNGAASVASSMFTLARTEAILRGVPVRVIVDADSSSQQPDSYYLRRMAVVCSTNSGTGWDSAAKWVTLPANASFNTNKSTKQDMTYSGLPGAFGAQAFYYYQFEPNGQMNPGAQFVVSPSVGGTNQLYGFKIHRMGKMTFFDNPSDIPDVTP